MKKYKPTLTYADIEWLKSELIPALAKAVQDGLAKKLDNISTKLDRFVGDIEAKREEQQLHSGQHKTIDDRLDTIEKHVGISP